jgi:hypothetical protein
MGDHLGTRIVAGSKARYCRIPLGYGCPGWPLRGRQLARALRQPSWRTPPISEGPVIPRSRPGRARPLPSQLRTSSAS